MPNLKLLLIFLFSAVACQSPLAYYQNRSSGQLVGLPLPIMTGQSTVQYNLPAVRRNKGWEFQVSSTAAEIGKVPMDSKWQHNVSHKQTREVSRPSELSRLHKQI